MKKFVVTGGSGFIGSNLVKFLLRKNYFVINIDKLSYSANPYNLKRIFKNKNYRFFKQDINNQAQIYKILNRYKPNGIFNLAAETHVDRSIDNPRNFIKSNILGVYNLLETLKKYSKKNKKKIRLVHVSTDEVYGDIEMGKKSKETSSYNPSSPYSATKASADLLIKSFVRTYKLPIIISNCCNNYGPYQFPEKFIPTIIINILNKKKIPVYGNGQNRREWIHVSDFCTALELIFRKGKINNTYNVGSGKRVTNLYLIKKIENIFKKKFKIGVNYKLIQYVADRPGHDKSYKIDSKKIRSQLNWQNKISLEHGLEETISWFINNNNWLKHTKKNYKGERLGLK